MSFFRNFGFRSVSAGNQPEERSDAPSKQNEPLIKENKSVSGSSHSQEASNLIITDSPPLSSRQEQQLDNFQFNSFDFSLNKEKNYQELMHVDVNATKKFFEEILNEESTDLNRLFKPCSNTPNISQNYLSNYRPSSSGFIIPQKYIQQVDMKSLLEENAQSNSEKVESSEFDQTNKGIFSNSANETDNSILANRYQIGQSVNSDYSKWLAPAHSRNQTLDSNEAASSSPSKNKKHEESSQLVSNPSEPVQVTSPAQSINGGSLSLTLNIRNLPPNVNWKPEIDVSVTHYDSEGQVVFTVDQINVNCNISTCESNLPLALPQSTEDLDIEEEDKEEMVEIPQRQDNSDEENDDFEDAESSSNDTDDQIEAGPEDNETEEENKSDLPEFNILLLGETGAGKSTTINAFANYMKYGSFEEANQAKEFAQLIPSKFTLPDPKTGKPFEVKSGEADSNERPENDGNSSTQSPVGYIFIDKNRKIRIIDTPGMGDTRGQEIDKQNFELILSYLNYHKQLHGICILIKSNETRRTASFRYCLTELLAHLHKSACQNIIFCFTFARNSFYGPGDGYTILKTFLQNDLQEMNLEVKNKVNCFFIDNEAYRFLVAKKQGYPFGEELERMYQESWDKSASSTRDMINTIVRLEPHGLQQTTSLNYARKLMIELAEPMVRLEKNIHKNIQQIENQNRELEQNKYTRTRLTGELRIEVDDLQMRYLDNPKTVCTEKKCIELILYNGAYKINYNSNCHVNCRLTQTQSNIIGAPPLKNCATMEMGRCKVCGCHWERHMHVSTEYVTVKRNIVDTNAQKGINRVSNSIATILNVLDNSKRILKEYRMELRDIQDIAAKFGYLLMVHSNMSHNKLIEPYLDKLIEEEAKMAQFIREYSLEDTQILINMKEDHTDRVKELASKISNHSVEEVKLEHIAELRQKLFDLKHNGPILRQMMQTSLVGRQEELKHFEKLGLDLTQM